MTTKKMKMIKQLFSKADAKAVAAFEREQARKNGRSLKKVETVRAMELYKTNKGLFDKMGRPWDEDYVVIVFYSKKDTCDNQAEVMDPDIETQNIEICVEKEVVQVTGKDFTVIKYSARMVRNRIIKVVERFVVTEDIMKCRNAPGLEQFNRTVNIEAGIKIL